MAPSVMLDMSDDFQTPSATKTFAAPRTLLLAPPSISSHPEVLNQILEAHDRSATDIQMLDRLAMGLVALPPATYDLILLLTNVSGAMAEIQSLLARDVMTKLIASMKAGGRFRSQDGLLGTTPSTTQTEAILAGLVNDGSGGMLKPNNSGPQTVSLTFGKKKANAAAVPLNAIEAANIGAVPLTTNGKRKSLADSTPAPAGVGFVDFGDDLDTGYDDEEGYESDEPYIPSNAELMNGPQIDPNTLLSEQDRQRPVIIPQECKPNGKRRRACKDCSCGLKQKIEAEDKAKRTAADNALETMKLGADDLTEVDFTVQGKVGSCGNCALGDAFRCDGCPYIGLPAFKPGEEVRLLNNDVQL
ncbi:electron carrier [Elasticomyces elasticus]|nr:electron carrier [Elasticomyces elasticus]